VNATLFVNGKIYTMDDKTPFAEAVYVENGKIVALGSTEELRLQFGRPHVVIEDLQGGTGYPGWVDSHLHLPGHGMKLSMLDFSNVTSKEEMLHLIRKKVRETLKGEWVLGLNWDENRFPDRAIPTIQELDEISLDHPIFLTRTCYHAYVANQSAFERAGLVGEVADPADGSYGRDAKGELNGLIYENASKPLLDAQPKPSYEQLKDNVRKAAKHALSLGLTAVHTEDMRYLGGLEQTLRTYRELLEEGIPLRTHHLIYHPNMEELAASGLTSGSGDEWLRIGAVKIFADGAIGGRTALLSEPYHDAPQTTGIAMHSQEEINEITLRARKLGMSIAVHAIGDSSADRVITAMEAYPVQNYSRYRDRLIHAQVMRQDLVERLQRLHVAVDIQPRFVASDFPWVMDRVGPDRYEYLYAWRKLISAGIHCAGGSDAPIEPLDPLLGLHAAITRRYPSENHEGYLPSEKLTLEEAIRLFTIGSALAATEEDERGTLAPGKYADMTVMNIDLSKLEPDEILSAKVKLTVTNGVVGYRGEL
jgi:predicted amidohydrolase YtcJ